MRTVGRTRVVELKRHTARMANTLTGLRLPSEGGIGTVAESMKILRDEQRLSSLLIPLLQHGLKAWRKMAPESEAKMTVLGCYDTKVRSCLLEKRCSYVANTHTSPFHLPPW